MMRVWSFQWMLLNYWADQEGGEPDNVILPDVQSEGTTGGITSVGMSGTSSSNVVGDLQEGTASCGQAGTVGNDAVASQLERMAAALITLTDRFDSMRGEVAELRSELAKTCKTLCVF
jgi:TolA-binding protein